MEVSAALGRGCTSRQINEANDTSDMFQPLSVGFCLIVVMYSMAVVSGAHFNPAVSIAVLILGKEKWWRCLGEVAEA
eukprot:5926133-Amphidinium_carterae.1